MIEKKNFKTRERKKIKSILVMFGGSDTYGLTNKCLDKLKNFKYDYDIGIIRGPLTRLKKFKDFKVYNKPNNILDIFYKYDLIICGGGLVPFEAAATGLPSFIISCETHEVKNANYLSKHNLSIYLGDKLNIDNINFNFDIDLNFLSKNCLKKMKPRGKFLIKKIITKLLKK